MSEAPSRRRVSYAQLDTLWEFLNYHRDIATGYNKTTQARDDSKRMWQNIAKTLNTHGDGALKDWKGWSKYWNHYKSKLKKTVAAIQSSVHHTGEVPSDAPSLSEVEQKFLHILDNSYGAGLYTIKIEPYDEEPETVEIDGTEKTNNLVENSIIISEHVQNDSFHPGPSTQAVSPPPVPRTPTPPPRAPPRRSPLTRDPPYRSPRPTLRRNSQQHPLSSGLRGPPSQRRRLWRGVPPMSQNEARRRLVAIAQENMKLDRERNEVLLDLVREVKKINEILRTRLPMLELPEMPDIKPVVNHTE